MQWLVTTLTTISVINVFLLRVSEKLLFKVFEAVPLSQFLYCSVKISLLWNNLLRRGCCCLNTGLQCLRAHEKCWSSRDLPRAWQIHQRTPRRCPPFWSSSWRPGRPPGLPVNILGAGKRPPPFAAVHLHPASPLSGHQLASAYIWAPFQIHKSSLRSTEGRFGGKVMPKCKYSQDQDLRAVAFEPSLIAVLLLSKFHEVKMGCTQKSLSYKLKFFCRILKQKV